MRAALRLAGTALALALLASAARAVEVPALRSRVMDRAELLPPDRERLLEGRLGRFEQEKGTQVVVHTTPSLEGLDIDTYSMRVAEAWKIGRGRIDDGVILTVAPNERKVRIEVGYGLEGAIPDALTSRIIQEQILPSFQSGRFADGIERGVDSILRLAAGEQLPAPRRSPVRDNVSWLYIFLFVLLFLVLPFFRSRMPYGGYRRRHGYGGFGGGGFGGGGFGRGGGGFGGGGFGGGGGRFGGGGASGSW